MGDESLNAVALRLRLQQLLPAIQEAEKALDAQQRRYKELEDATSAAESTRDALAEALQAPVCVAQAAANHALRDVAALEPAAVNEVRSLSSPPRVVVRTLELIHILLFGSVLPKVPPPWTELQKMLRRSDFLARVKGFRAKGSILETNALVCHLRTTYFGTHAAGSASSAVKCKASQATATAAGRVQPLTEDIVKNASQPVALLFVWAQAQLNLAPLLHKASEAQALNEGDISFTGQLSTAEAARERLTALAAVADLQESVHRHASLSSPVVLVDAVYSADCSLDAVQGLEAQLRGAEAFLSELMEHRSAKEAAIAVAKTHLADTQAEGATLEMQIEAVAAIAQAAGPPFCSCEFEMVRRECTDLVSSHYGEMCWRCPKGSAGCGERIWDEVRTRGEVPIGFKFG